MYFVAAEKDKKSSSNKDEDKEMEKEMVLPSSSPPDNEFISDAFNGDNINEEDLRAEMQQIGLTETNIPSAKTEGINSEIQNTCQCQS